MLIYWLLFAFPAIMALGYPTDPQQSRRSAAQAVAFLGFVSFYVLLAGFRHEIGGDWQTYEEIFEDIRTDTFGYALTITDPLYGLLNWTSAQLGTGVYLVNGVCALILVGGLSKVALRLPDPWLAIVIAVPYLLIVVGLGYVRQSAAIGLVLAAIATLGEGKPGRTVAYLVLGLGFHSTAIAAFPLFAYAMTSRYKGLAVVFAVAGALGWIFVLEPRLARFEVGYIEQAYESGGAAVRLLMSLLPSALVLFRWKHIQTGERVRSVWISVAIANLFAYVALLVSPSSTAVDRIALFFAIIQPFAFGMFRLLVPMQARFLIPVRLALIAAAAVVQSIWLIFGTHAEYWVPYSWILDAY